MKKLASTLSIFVLSQMLVAQSPWTGTSLSGPIYRNGPVGIGVTTPSYILDVRSTSVNNGIAYTNLSNSGSAGLFLSNSFINSTWQLWATGADHAWGANNFQINNENSVTPEFMIKSGGNVGINNTNPLQKLHINVSTPGDGIKVTQTQSHSSALHLHHSVPGGHNWSLYSLGTGDGWPNAVGGFAIHDAASYFPRFFIDGNNGNVGIGTTTPNRKLTVGGDLLVGTHYDVNGVYTDNFEITVNGTTPVRRGISVNPGGGAMNFYTYGGPADAAFNFKEIFSGNTLMKIGINGLVQIGTGTLNPGGIHANAKLSVDGKVIAKSLYVTLAAGVWADYVFDKNYKLLPINELEKFVAKNKHLPNVPSATEVETNGVNVAETNAKLLEKIEEAYLYIIELNKKIEALEAKLEQEQ